MVALGCDGPRASLLYQGVHRREARRRRGVRCLATARGVRRTRISDDVNPLLNVLGGGGLVLGLLTTGLLGGGDTPTPAPVPADTSGGGPV